MRPRRIANRKGFTEATTGRDGAETTRSPRRGSYGDLPAKENRMILSVGNKVVYPNQGPCRIGEVVEKMIGGRPTSFYQLALLDESGDALFVPLDKIRTL